MNQLQISINFPCRNEWLLSTIYYISKITEPISRKLGLRKSNFNIHNLKKKRLLVSDKFMDQHKTYIHLLHLAHVLGKLNRLSY